MCILLSIGAVALEVFFFVAVLWRRATPFFLLGGAALHISIFVLQAAPFFQLVILHVVFIDFERLVGLRSGGKGWDSRGRPEISQIPAGA